MRVLIVGANGFLGGSLFQFLLEKGVDVYGITHSTPKDRIFLLEELPIKNFTHIIYLSHINDYKIVKWYKNVLEVFKDVKYHYYISSYSANHNAISDYGIIKYQIEEMFLQRGYYVISPGLVVGKGGVFKKILKIVNSFFVIPYPYVKNGKIPFISVDLLNNFILNTILTPPNKQKFIVYSERLEFIEVLRLISLYQNKKRVFIKIDGEILLKIVKLFDIFNISDNLKGFIINSKMELKSDLEKKESIKNYLKRYI
jgi:nucleoside-diphosphate-sugar epimerase